MSKKTSPQSRPARRPRTRGPQQTRAGGQPSTPTAKPAGRAGRSGRKDDTEQRPVAPVNFRGRLRRYLPTALIPNIVAVLSVIVVALAVLLLGSVEMAALPATIAQFWLILNLVPVSFEANTIGLLPMLPALGFVWLISRQVNKAVRDRVSVADLGVLLLSILAVPLILTGIAAGMLWDAGAVYAVSPPAIPQLLARVVVLHLVAMGIGMGAKLWRALFRRYGLPEAFVDNARSALRWLKYLVLASLAVLLIAMAVGWQRQAELADIYNGAGALVALGMVSLLYLPNALIGVAAVLVGAEFHIGEASVSLFSTHHTPLPPMPLIAAIPPESQVWFPVLLLIPAAIAGYLAFRANPTLISATATGLFAGLFALTAGYLAQGQLGAFGPAGPMVLLGAGLAFVWLAAVGIATALLLKLAERRQLKATAADEAGLGATAASDDPYIAEEVDGPEAEDETDPEESGDSEDLDDAELVDEEDTELTDDAGESEAAESEAMTEEATEPDHTEPDDGEETTGEEDTADPVEIAEPEEGAAETEVQSLPSENDSEPENRNEDEDGEAEGPPESPKR